MADKQELIGLAGRMAEFDRKLQSIVANRSGSLSDSGQAMAMAMLVSIHLSLFGKVAAALRALAGRQP